MVSRWSAVGFHQLRVVGRRADQPRHQVADFRLGHNFAGLDQQLDEIARRGALQKVDRVTGGIPSDFDRVREQRFPARLPAPVDAGFRDTRLLGDLLDTRSGDPVFNEKFQGCAQDRRIDRRIPRLFLARYRSCLFWPSCPF